MLPAADAPPRVSAIRLTNSAEIINSNSGEQTTKRGRSGPMCRMSWLIPVKFVVETRFRFVLHCPHNSSGLWQPEIVGFG